MHIFPLLVKSMHIFPPNDLKCTKLRKKGGQFFACGAHPLLIKNLLWGKIIIQEGGRGEKILISN